jgi:predicted GIY-YIG superfamily endonuclease
MNDSLELVYHEECSDVRDAIAREKQLKWWSRKKKELLIDWNIEWLIKYGSDA